MGYSNYKRLEQVVEKFDLKVKRTSLTSLVQLVPPSDWLVKTLEIAYAVPLLNEKVKSERIISPVLSEVHQLYKNKFSLFSGAELNVSPKDDLNGPCDFFFSAVPDAYLLEAPIVSFCEANPEGSGEDIDYGIAQCTAQMIGAKQFNEQKQTNTKAIWGCATIADVWQFLKLEDKTLYIDTQSYYIGNLALLLGVFKKIFEDISNT